MLTEAERAVLVDDIASDRLDFTLGDFVPDVKVYRFKEGFSKHRPLIMIEFLPANRSKFRSVANAIGIAQGRYVEYGYCQMEYCAFKCYCGEFHDGKELNGRILAEHILQVIRKHVLKNWGYVLKDMAATLDTNEEVAIRDVTTYERRFASKVYVYEMEIYLRTQFRWNRVPDDYVPAPVEEIGVFYKEDREEVFQYELVKEED